VFDIERFRFYDEGVVPRSAAAAVAVALARTLNTFLYGIAPTDSMSFVMAGLVLIGVSTFASLVPARRATRIDPIHALRSE